MGCEGTATHAEFCFADRAQGRLWAMHVLEAPIAWIMSTCYIAATVWSTTPLIAAATALWGAQLPSPGDDAPASHFVLK